ncbi:MAG: hypothetical protein N3F03_06055 [Ignavibacteria bacterium]|nr:hypothetical protein [Ignavibacteria bacterium]
MKLKLIVLLVIFFSIDLVAQQFQLNSQIGSDSNYIAFLRIKGLLSDEYNSFIKDKKCGFHLVNSIKMNFENYSLDKQQKIKSVLQRPTKQATYITPSGKFKIHYDTTGANSIKYSIHELARALDSVYYFEVFVMGFPPAPNDLGNGGDDRYDVYVHNISPVYGYTEFEDVIGSNRYSSFMVIDDSFHENDYYTKGIDAARVTVAHEYHHAIQIGNYRYSEGDVWFYELTSTSMEEFVFDTINDYYAYIPTFFNRPDKIFTSFDGYSQAIWNIYLHKIFNYDFSIFVRQWELVKNHSALEAIKKSIEERGRIFKSVFSQFYVYNYYTGYRSKPDKYYEEGKNYPLVRFNYPIQFIQPSRTISGSSQPCAANYFLVIDSISRVPLQPDSIVIILVNANIDSALNWSSYSRPFNYVIKLMNNQNDPSYKKISSNIFSKLEVNDINNWSEYYIINDSTASQIFMNTTQLAFPMPANLNKHSYLNIPVPSDWLGEVQLLIYSTSMKLIFASKEIPQIFEDKIVVRWNGKDELNKKVSSGIYFYTLINGDKKSTGKIVIVNE